MEWKYVKPLESIGAVDDFEKAVGYTFSEDFKKCVQMNNGGRPSKRSFCTRSRREHTLKSFLSFNKSDRETVWKMYDWNSELLNNQFIPFAIDNFGNLICFDKRTGSVNFLDHETSEADFISKDFSDFMAALYE